MLQKTQGDIELESLILGQEDGLRASFRNNFRTQESTLAIILEAKEHTDANHMENHSIFWNAAGFINLCSFDLKIVVPEMTFSTNEWSKRYFARQTCQLLYELVNDLFEILGKEFRIKLDSLSDRKELEKEHEVLCKI